MAISIFLYSLVKGYKIYCAPSGSAYPERATRVVNDPSQSSCSISGLTEGEIYGFVATSYDANGNESDTSNEVFYNVPLSSTYQDTDNDGLPD